MRQRPANDRKTYISQRLSVLRARAAAGEIAALAEHPTWPIRHREEHICTVAADFFYRLVQRGTSDAAGVAEFVNVPNSGAHALHKKLLKAFHGVESRDVRV